VILSVVVGNGLIPRLAAALVCHPREDGDQGSFSLHIS